MDLSQDPLVYTNSSPFTYEPLPPPPSFRLVTLLPGSPDSPIECHVDIVENPTDATYSLYEALSYEWGSTSELYTISCNDRPFRVPRNLRDALYRLRSMNSQRILWIDYICINQTDIDEKNKQVQHMKTLFSKARGVLCWLGEEDTDMPRIFQAICLVHMLYATGEPTKDQNRVNKANKRCSACTNSIVDENRLCSDILDEHDWHDALSLFNRSYFSRLWIFREMLVMRKGLLICGKSSLPWTRAQQFLLAFHAKLKSVCRLITDRDNGGEIWTTMMIVTFARYGRTEFDFPSSGLESLTNLMGYCRILKVSDPRDKVYAIWDLDPQQKRVPDYGLTVRRVYTIGAFECCLKDGIEGVFREAVTKKTSDQFPSWVPDWTIHSKMVFGEAYRKFNASQTATSTQLNHLASLEGDSENLELLALHIATICAIPNAVNDASESSHFVGQPPYGSGFKRFMDNGTWEKLANTISIEGRYMLTDEPLHLAFTRTRLRDSWSLPGEESTLQHHHFTLAKYQSQIQGPSDLLIGWDDDSIYGQMLRQTSDCNFFTTSEKMMGLGPETLLPQDEIFVVPGCDLPVILRPDATDSTYTLVGLCYLHGVMDGEAIRTMAMARDQTLDRFMGESLDEYESWLLQPEQVPLWTRKVVIR